MYTNNIDISKFLFSKWTCSNIMWHWPSEVSPTLQKLSVYSINIVRRYSRGKPLLELFPKWLIPNSTLTCSSGSSRRWKILKSLFKPYRHGVSSDVYITKKLLPLGFKSWKKVTNPLIIFQSLFTTHKLLELKICTFGTQHQFLLRMLKIESHWIPHLKNSTELSLSVSQTENWHCTPPQLNNLCCESEN